MIIKERDKVEGTLIKIGTKVEIVNLKKDMRDENGDYQYSHTHKYENGRVGHHDGKVYNGSQGEIVEYQLLVPECPRYIVGFKKLDSKNNETSIGFFPEDELKIMEVK